jgi:competence protein CoiA
MVFVGVHDDWGLIDATQPDLGCGQSRQAIYKTKPPAALTCYECAWPLHLVHKAHPAYDLWFLRHANNAPRCAAKTAGEGMQHHLLKLDLAAHVRAVPGWTATYEAPAADGSWRADVLAVSPDGSRRVALEAQMASISVADIGQRTVRYAAYGLEACWFTDRKTVPWLGSVPAVQIARPQDGGPVTVTAGPVRFVPQWCEDRSDCGWCECADCGAGVDAALPCGGHGAWREVAPFELSRFIAAICAGTVRPHRLRSGGDSGVLRWVTRPYYALEEEQVRAESFRQQAISELAVPRRSQAGAITVRDAVRRLTGLDRM